MTFIKVLLELLRVWVLLPSVDAQQLSIPTTGYVRKLRLFVCSSTSATPVTSVPRRYVLDNSALHKNRMRHSRHRRVAFLDFKHAKQSVLRFICRKNCMFSLYLHCILQMYK